MNVVVDASVALKWLIAEDDSATALQIRAKHGILAPELLLIECRNALLTRVRRQRIRRSEAEEAERALNADRLGIDVVPSSALLQHAFTLALALHEPIYDCIYLAAALATERILITARFATCGKGFAITSSRKENRTHGQFG